MGLRQKLGKWLLGYDAANTSSKRRSPSAIMRSEDRELFQSQRRQLIASARDLPRNFTIAAYALRRHLDFVSTFKFQARTGNEAFDDQLEEYMRWYSQPENCDYSARHSLGELIRMAESLRTVDGDCLVNFVQGGSIQLIEGDRVATPVGGFPVEYTLDPDRIQHGVIVGDTGRPLGFVVCTRNQDRLIFDRIMSPQYAVLHGYFSRYDQVRGVSPLAPAINAMQDVYESFDHALAKAKVSQLFALAFYREANDSLGSVTTSEDTDGNTTGYEVDFNKGPIQLDLDPGDRAEFLHAQTPSTEFQQFTQTIIGAAIKALDIPYSFYDEAHTNYSGARLAGLAYEMSAKIKREQNKRLLDKIKLHAINSGIQRRLLTLPSGMTPEMARGEWIAMGLPWYDPLKEVNADVAAIAAGLKSPQMSAMERGVDPYEVIDQTKEFQEYAASKGVVLNWNADTSVPSNNTL